MKHTVTARLFALVLCLVCVTALFAGCKGKQEASSTQSKAAVSVESRQPTQIIEETTGDKWLPESKDLGGFEMTVALPAGNEDILIPEEGKSAEGDLMLEALRKTQEAYKCTISVTPVEGSWSDEVMTSLLAGDTYAHVLMPCVHESGQFISARLCTDYQNEKIREFIHMEEPWWNDTMAYASNVLGSVYAGACNIQSMADMAWVIYFNKRLLKEIGSSEQEIYKMYTDKTWNWDAFRALSKKAVKDKNNDGKLTLNDDQWGLSAPGYDCIQAMVQSAYLGSIVTDNGMNPHYNYDTAAAISALTSLNELYTTDGSYCLDSWNGDAYQTLFADGRALFMGTRLGKVTNDFLREMEDEYGIMPIPLGPDGKGGWQKEYASRVDHNFRLCLIPSTNADLNNTALVLESIAFNYWKIINDKTATYGALYLSDDTAAEIANNVYNWSHFEISQFFYSINNSAYAYLVENRLRDVVRKSGYDVSGEFTSIREAAQTIIDDYFAGL